MEEVRIIFSVFMSTDIPVDTKVKFLDLIEPDWFLDKWQQQLFGFISSKVAKGQHPDLMSCVMYFKELNLFNGNFKINDLMDINSKYNATYLPRVREYIDMIEHNYQMKVIGDNVQTINHRILNNNGNIEEIKGLLENSLDVTQKKHIETVNNTDVLNNVIKDHYDAQDGKIKGIDLGFISMRRKVLIEPVDMMVIAARPSMGKTAVGVTVLRNLALKQGLKVKFIALEMSAEQMMRRLISQETGIPSWKIKYGKCNDREISQIDALKEHVNWDNFEIIAGAKTVDHLYMLSSKWSMNEDADIIIIDYLQKLSSKHIEKYKSVTYSSNKIKEISQDFGIPTIALAQLSRASEQRGGDKKPMLSDLRDSGEIEQDASIIAFLHRPEYYGFLQDEDGNSNVGLGEFIIAKNREGDLSMHTFNINQDTIEWVDSEELSEPIQTNNNTLNNINIDFDGEGDDFF